MRLTSSSFFHFAKDFNTIKAILADGFKVFYCLEEIYSTRKGVQHIGIPMASFCDIPLSRIPVDTAPLCSSSTDVSNG